MSKMSVKETEPVFVELSEKTSKHQVTFLSSLLLVPSNFVGQILNVFNNERGSQ